MANTHITSNDFDGYVDTENDSTVFLRETVIVANSAPGGIAVDMQGLHASVQILGSVFSHAGAGIMAWAQSTINVAATGSVAGNQASAIILNGMDTTLLNSGSVTAYSNGHAAVLFDSGFGNSQLSNKGTISGRAYGVTFNAGFSSSSAGTIDNAGTIQAPTAILATGADIQNVNNAGAIRGAILLAGESDTLGNSGNITGAIDLGGGDDAFDNTGGNIRGAVAMGDGSNGFNNSGTLTGAVTSGNGDDTIGNSGNLRGAINAGDGQNIIDNSGTLAGAVTLGVGDDTIDNAGGSIKGAVSLGSGTNTLDNGNGTIHGGITGGGDYDKVDNSRGTIRGNVSLGDGNNLIVNFEGWIRGSVFVSGLTPALDNREGRISGNVSVVGTFGGSIDNAGGSILGSVFGGTGWDNVRNTGGRILGDVLLGDGNDTFDTRDGRTGSIVLLEGGNDTYLGSDYRERAGGGAGSDTVDLGGGNDIAWIGFEVDDGDDDFDGGDGIDTLDLTNANAGVTADLDSGFASGQSVRADLIANFENITGSAYEDSLIGDDSRNTLRGNTGRDDLDGGGGADTLDGGGDNDTMTGGSGNDVYRVDNMADVVTEVAGGGIDRVSSTVTYTLTDEVEKLVLSGTAAINGAGNALANSIAGNSANNYLYGYLGNDTITGGGGNDVFVFNTAIGPTPNIDRIRDFSPADDTMLLDDAIFSAISPTGTLAGSKFVTGSAALDGLDRIIYNPVTGAVLYDADGTGSTAAIQFSRLAPGLAVTNFDFLIY